MSHALTPARVWEPTARLAAFAALAALAAWQWTRLVADPPAARVVLAVAALSAGAALLALIGAADLRRTPRWALAALATLVMTAVSLFAVGVPADTLWPEGWDRLADGVGRGFAGLDGSVEYPYGGKNEWSRLVLLAGLALSLGLAAALAFWPFRRTRRGRRTMGLAILIATWAVAAAAVEPGEPLLLGLLLLALVAAWLWLPGLGRRDAVAAGALIAAAGVLGVAAAGALDADRPLIEYRDWKLAGNEGDAEFVWNHGYGPLDWPREGTTLLDVESDEPHYWKAAVLDEFDGTRWLQSGNITGERFEVPTQVESGINEVDRAALNQKWVEEVGVAFGPMESELVIAPGTLIELDGLEDVSLRPDGTTVTDSSPLEDGDAYSAVAYVPEPRPAQMRAAPRRYSPVLSQFTEIGMPSRTTAYLSGPLVETVHVPLRGSLAARGVGGEARRQILDSRYARAYRLARRITAGEPNPYRAAMAIEEFLKFGPYGYAEAIPQAGRYPLNDFLFRDRRGYCQQFSGAMVLMLRMIGIPSRVATGFTAGVENPDARNHYVVTDFDAHSWVEIYFNGIGWVPFEPTSAAAPAESQIGEGSFLAGVRTPDSEGEPQALTDRRGDEAGGTAPSSGGGGIWKVVFAGLGVLGLAVAVPAAVRARRYRLMTAAEAADAQLRELDSGLGRLGLAIDPGETLMALEPRLRRRLGPATASYVAKLRAGRFGRGNSTPPTLGERRSVRRELRSSKSGSRGRLRVAFAFPPGAPRRN